MIPAKFMKQSDLNLVSENITIVSDIELPVSNLQMRDLLEVIAVYVNEHLAKQTMPNIFERVHVEEAKCNFYLLGVPKYGGKGSVWARIRKETGAVYTHAGTKPMCGVHELAAHPDQYISTYGHLTVPHHQLDDHYGNRKKGKRKPCHNCGAVKRRRCDA